MEERGPIYNLTLAEAEACIDKLVAACETARDYIPRNDGVLSDGVRLTLYEACVAKDLKNPLDHSAFFLDISP